VYRENAVVAGALSLPDTYTHMHIECRRTDFTNKKSTKFANLKLNRMRKHISYLRKRERARGGGRAREREREERRE